MTDLATRYTTLRQAVAQKEQARVRAETTLEHAKAALAGVEKEIRAFGIEPDQLDAELKKLETQLTRDADTLEKAVQVELQAYQQIVQQS